MNMVNYSLRRMDFKGKQQRWINQCVYLDWLAPTIWQYYINKRIMIVERFIWEDIAHNLSNPLQTITDNRAMYHPQKRGRKTTLCTDLSTTISRSCLILLRAWKWRMLPTFCAILRWKFWNDEQWRPAPLLVATLIQECNSRHIFLLLRQIGLFHWLILNISISATWRKRRWEIDWLIDSF